MFETLEPELTALQDQLDRERAMLDRARWYEAPPESPQPPFCMIDLYAIIPECDTSSFQIQAYRDFRAD